MALDLDILGSGIYSPRQAARLTGSTPLEVLRWTRGSGPSEPLWKAYYHSLDDTSELSFADLIELRVVKAFRGAGISLQAIRYAISFAKEKFGLERPLSSRQFKTDGRQILMDAIENDGELVTLRKKDAGQKVFSEIVRQSLSDVEYEESKIARWRPSKPIVIDPKRSFGDPILDRFGLSTAMIAKESEEFQDTTYVASLYEIPVDAVASAVKFEAKLDDQLT